MMTFIEQEMQERNTAIESAVKEARSRLRALLDEQDEIWGSCDRVNWQGGLDDRFVCTGGGSNEVEVAA